MAITNYEINTYRLYHFNVENSYGQTAVINCYHNNAFKGTLYFYKDGTTIPASQKTSSGYLYLRFHEARFSEMVDSLRLEKPLYMGFNDGNLWGWLASSNEPVGEEET